MAAGEEFAARGYAGATVNRIAATAGVSVQTLYLAWGSKRALLRAHVELLLAGTAPSPAAAASQFIGLAPRARVAALAAAVAATAARAANGWTLYRDAAAVDSEIASDWNELQLLRHRLFETVIEAIPLTSLLRGLSTRRAVDTAWAIASPETHELLVNRLGYTLEEFRDWLDRTLAAALLRPNGPAPK
jgi:AcrR family transcriptional regulator